MIVTYSNIKPILPYQSVMLFTFSAATSITWSSSSIPKLMNNETSSFGRPITVEESAWITSSLTLGSTIGTSICCYLASSIGRKPTLLSIGFISMFSNLLIAFCNLIEIFYLARFLSGIAVTGSLFIVSIYLSEVVHKTKRTLQLSLLSISVCSGMLFSNIVGLFVTITTLNVIVAVISFFFLVLFKLFGEESKCFIKANEKLSGKKVVVEKEIELKHVEELFINIPSVNKREEKVNLFTVYKSKVLRKAFIIVNTLLILQQLTGIDVVLYYGVQLTENFSSTIKPEISVIILGVFHLLSSFILPVIGPKFNNKTLLLVSAIGMFTSQLLLTYLSYLQTLYSFSVYLNVLSLIILICYIISYNSGFGPLPFLFIGEMFPKNVKLLSTGITGTIFWGIAFVITKNFYGIICLIGFHGYLLFCSFCCFLGIIFSKYYLIETKNKTLEEIQLELDK
ncbi:facilitated trehalose transporter Tret1-like [Diabrotica undecimpunctata]|uniref:facilitated trehalose transporter Tret1-like n=1 Tax=Diabrotica undecimpunctata TaxID=50387 RepID=UPI003B634A22